MQDRASYSINSADTSVSHSTQLESAIPRSKISALSSGEFVGMVADDPTQKIESKAFHWEVLNDYEALKNEQDSYKQIPVVRKPDNAMVQKNYLQIKQDMQDIINSKMQRVLGDRVLEHLVVRKA
jgi:hypothetical protein